MVRMNEYKHLLFYYCCHGYDGDIKEVKKHIFATGLNKTSGRVRFSGQVVVFY